MTFILGILAGLVMPAQTSINTRLRKSLGTPFRASLVNFAVGLVFLVLLSFVMGDGLFPVNKLSGLPWWMFLGGFCGVSVLTANLLLFPVLGATQTVVFPVFGQILMGLLIDTFGWFRAAEVPMTAWRAIGAVLVFLGVVLVAVEGKKGNEEPSAGEPAASPATIWACRAIGVAVGMLGSVQVSVNGQLGVELGSYVHSSMVNFIVGTVLLALICLFLHRRAPAASGKGPWWMWVGGLLGGAFVLFNVYLQHKLGTGMTVILNLTGLTAGGLLIDQTGILESPKKPVSFQKVLGVLIMLAGAAMIRLL